MITRRRFSSLLVGIATALSPVIARAQSAIPYAAPPEMPAMAALPRDLSVIGMLLGADYIVQAVMIGLAIASVITWTIWVAKSAELYVARQRARSAQAALSEAKGLVDGTRRLAGVPKGSGVVGVLLRAASKEVRLSGETPHEKEGVKERVASRLERIEASEGRRLARGTGVLATIGATAPFVGLFGTVWGIMNSFIGISKAQTTNLAVVAPGIAEALLATALGLVAAIPAVMIYNIFARAISSYKAQVGDASAEVLRLVSRDLDREGRAFAKAAE